MARFTRSAAVAERRAKVLALRNEQHTYTEIGAQLGISAKLAEADYRRSLEELRRQQAAQAHLAKEAELARLAAAERAAWEVLRRKHIHVQHGKIVRDEDGQAVEDDAPVLNAIDRILKISERRSRLLGLDAPARVEVTDAVDAEIRDLAAWLGAMEPGGEAAAPGGAEAGPVAPRPA